MTTRAVTSKPDSQWVVIVCDDAHVGRDLVERWQTEREIPEFTSMTSDLWERAAAICEHDAIRQDPAPIHDYDYDLAIVAGVSGDKLAATLRHLPPGTPAIAILPPEISLRQLRSEYPRVLPLRHADDTLDIAVLAGAELLRRSAYQKRIAVLDQSLRNMQTQAALGRYMLECRHNFNNALTSVLGTAELLAESALQPVDEVRDQVRTIHMMALRMQSLMQRFSAIEAEIKLAEWKRSKGSLSQSQNSQDVVSKL
jgi:signal transduction histidine kinase